MASQSEINPFMNLGQWSSFNMNKLIKQKKEENFDKMKSQDYLSIQEESKILPVDNSNQKKFIKTI